MDLKKILGIFIVFFIIISIIFVFIIPIIPLPEPIIKVGNAVEEIGNAISSNNNTVLYINYLKFAPTQVISVKHFETKIEPCAIFFDANDFGEYRLLTKDYEIDKNGDCSASVYNETNAPVRARAVVICGQDGESLQNNLDDFKDGAYEVPNELMNKNNDFTKVCAIIFKRV